MSKIKENAILELTTVDGKVVRLIVDRVYPVFFTAWDCSARNWNTFLTELTNFKIVE